MLSLYERGEVMTLKPQLLWLLGQVYGVPYEELVRRWVTARFGVNFRATRTQPDRLRQLLRDGTALLRLLQSNLVAIARELGPP